jgi:ribonuclease HI
MGMGEVIAYTDGACHGNPGPGGWGFRLEWPDGTVEEGSGGAVATTNNRMELTAIGEAVRAFRARSVPGMTILVRTDSLLCLNQLSGGWKRKVNRDLFAIVDPLIDRRVRFEWVRGHNGDPGNERADRLATQACAKVRRETATARQSGAPAAVQAGLPGCWVRL